MSRQIILKAKVESVNGLIYYLWLLQRDLFVFKEDNLDEINRFFKEDWLNSEILRLSNSTDNIHNVHIIHILFIENLIISNNDSSILWIDFILLKLLSEYNFFWSFDNVFSYYFSSLRNIFIAVI